MKQSLTLLLSSAGRRVELLRRFQASARTLQIPLRIIAADASPSWSPACAVADTAFAVPPCSDAAFIPHMLSLCATNAVDLLVPTIDTELLPYAEHHAAFAAIGTRVMVSTADVVGVFRDKLATMEHLARLDIPVPQTWSCSDVPRSAWDKPLFCKPRHGSCSVGARLLTSAKDAATLRPDDIVQEYVTGREMTVNMFVREDGALVCAVPHHRRLVRDGEVCLAETMRLPEMELVARRLTQGFPGMQGALCFQAIVCDAGDFRVIEVNPRFGGGYPIAHRAGATMTTWLLQEVLGQGAPKEHPWQSGVRMLRYDASLFVEATC